MALALSTVLACSGPPGGAVTPMRRVHRWPAPAPEPLSPTMAPAEAGASNPEVGVLCADVGSRRACWGGPGAAGAWAPRRPLPGAPALSPLGWRCTGRGAERSCVDRAAGVSPFICAGPRCAQAHPRLPDDGDWTCAEMGGAAICLGGSRAAGVAAAPRDPGWFCGARRASAPEASEGQGARVCVDLSPDFPDGEMSTWRCRYVHEPIIRRVCERRGDAHLLTDPCDAAHPCLDGSRCASGRCLPERPDPSCWIDADCAAGSCRFGSCVSGVP